MSDEAKKTDAPAAPELPELEEVGADVPTDLPPPDFDIPRRFVVVTPDGDVTPVTGKFTLFAEPVGPAIDNLDPNATTRNEIRVLIISNEEGAPDPETGEPRVEAFGVDLRSVVLCPMFLSLGRPVCMLVYTPRLVPQHLLPDDVVRFIASRPTWGYPGCENQYAELVGAALHPQ